MSFIWVSIGGGIGALARFFLSKGINRILGQSFPFATLIINYLGAFVFGFTLIYYSNQFMNRLFHIGFLGGFTTFSTFAIEVLFLFNSNRKSTSILYVLFSLIGTIIFFYLGMILYSLFK